MAVVLRLLGEARGVVVPSAWIWRAVPDYEGDAGSNERRLYREDLKEMRDRGLIDSDITSPATPTGNGVKLKFVGKPQDWELTAREHAALRSARRRYDRQAPSVAAGGTSRGVQLGVAMDALRVLEEHGATMTGAELASELCMSASKVIDALTELDEAAQDGVYLFASYLTLDRYDSIGRRLPPGRVKAMVSRGRSLDRPLWRSGLAAVGRFAYNQAEVDDRLRAIDAALAASEPSDDIEALNTARRKLSSWSSHLKELSSRS